MPLDVIARSESHSTNFFNVSLSTEIQTPLVSNDNREGILIFNDADQDLLVSFTDTVSEDEYTFKILPGGYYESGSVTYMGAVHLVWVASGTGKALVTELEG